MKAINKTWLLTLLTLFGTTSTVDVGAEGIGGTGIVQGQIARFGSIVIDGVHYDTTTAVIRVNGSSAYEHDLKQGNRVVIRGDLNVGEAWSVDYFDTVAGPVAFASVGDAALGVGELQIMEQRVVTTPETWFYGTDIESISAGQQVAISGSILADGTVVASSVEAVYRYRQVVSGVVTASSEDEFSIGLLCIDSEDVDDDDGGIDPEEINVGQRLHVTGVYPGAGCLQADAIYPMDEAGAYTEDAVIHGPLSLDGGTWELNGFELDMTGTAFLAGSSGDLASGAQVAVRGVLLSNGVLRAFDMEFERSAFSRLDGPISAIDPDQGTVTVDGVELQLDDSVSMRDDRDGFRWFAPDDLGAHDSVSVIVEESEGVARVRRVTRRATVRRMMRSRVSGADWFGEVRAMTRELDDLANAGEVQFDGQPIDAGLLRWIVRDGDDIELEWGDDGGLERVIVETN